MCDNNKNGYVIKCFKSRKAYITVKSIRHIKKKFYSLTTTS